MIRRFNRFELKFIIDAACRDALCTDLRHHMRPDDHGEGGCYRVTSLYYDSPGVSCFLSKVEGIKYRRKVRIRTYGPGAACGHEPVMVEIKQRINRTVQKRRLALALNDAYALCDGGAARLSLDRRDAQVAAEVTLLARMLDLQPACVITYRRQAFLGSDYEVGLRITFDDTLAVRGPKYGLAMGSGSNHAFMPPGQLVLEVKANDTVPLWVTRMLARHGCILVRISKYCTGLARLRRLPHAEPPGLANGSDHG